MPGISWPELEVVVKFLIPHAMRFPWVLARCGNNGFMNVVTNGTKVLRKRAEVHSKFRLVPRKRALQLQGLSP